MLVVTLVWGSGEDLRVLVAPEDVAGVPDGKEAAGNDHELASNEKSASRVVSIVREESNEESNSNKVWDEENNSNKGVPPVIRLVKEAVEHLGEDGNEKDAGEDTDSNNTALNWEASEALEGNGLLGGAVADAAAAKAALLLLGKFFEGLSSFWLFGGLHKWSLLHVFGHHHGFITVH